nr:immunoglobulin heavy chain junction region [Mus musculus]
CVRMGTTIVTTDWYFDVW